MKPAGLLIKEHAQTNLWHTVRTEFLNIFEALSQKTQRAQRALHMDRTEISFVAVV